MKNLLFALGFSALAACSQKPEAIQFQEGFGEISKVLYTNDTILEKTILSSLTVEEITRLALPETNISRIIIYASNPTSSYYLKEQNSPCGWLVYANEPVTKTDVRYFFDAMRVVDYQDTVVSHLAAGELGYFEKKHSKQLTAGIYQSLLENAGYTVKTTIEYDSLPGVVFTNARMPLEKLVR